MSELVLRPARPEDEKDVVALSDQIWEGDDYVANRFGAWLADQTGQFTVACRKGQLVGFGKLTRLAVGEWWLEGLRVHPAFREQGIASQLHRYAVQLALSIGSGTLRLATSMHNVAIHTMVAKTGFHKVSEHSLARFEHGAPRRPTAGQFSLVAADELATVDAWLSSSPRFTATGGLFERRWKWLELRPRLQRLQAEGALYWWRSAVNHSHTGIAVATPGDEGTLWINYIDTQPEAMAELIASLPDLAAPSGQELLRAKPATDEALLNALRDARWQIEPDFGIWVFERRLLPRERK